MICSKGRAQNQNPYMLCKRFYLFLLGLSTQTYRMGVQVTLRHTTTQSKLLSHMRALFQCEFVAN